MRFDYIPAQFINKEEFERVLNYDVDMLTEWAKRIVQFYWNVEFNIPIRYTEEVHRTYGMFTVNTLTMDQTVLLSKRLVKHNYYNPLMVEKILKHELCHWYLFNYNNQRGFKDGQTAFEEEIRRIGSVSQFDIFAGLVKPIQHRPKKKLAIKNK